MTLRACLRARLRRAWLLSTLLFLTGCAHLHADMQDMTLAYEQSIETHSRQVILLNLLRASDGLPMIFTAIPTWTGSGGVQGTAGVNGQLFGRLLGDGRLSASMDVSRSFNFTLSSLDNAQFTQGFFADVPLDRFHVFASSSEQSPGLVYTLMVARIDLDFGLHAPQRFTNQANAAHFQAFQQALQELLASGLRTELAPPGQAPEPQALAYRFCADASQAAQEPALAFAPSLACRRAGARPIQGAVAAEPSPAVQAMSIDLRSTRDVFRYLGSMVRQDLETGHDGAGAWRWDRVDGKPLLDLRRGRPAPGQRSVAAVSYQGQDYFVALDDGSQSAAVFEVLASLLAMNKISGSIPASPGIVVR